MEGINAWESRTSNEEEKVKGLAAKARRRTSYGTSHCMFVWQGQVRRWIGTLFSGESNINEQLVEKVMLIGTMVASARNSNELLALQNRIDLGRRSRH